MNKLTKQDIEVLDKITKMGHFKSWKEKRKHETSRLEEFINLRVEEAVIVSRLATQKKLAETKEAKE